MQRAARAALSVHALQMAWSIQSTLKGFIHQEGTSSAFMLAIIGIATVGEVILGIVGAVLLESGGPGGDTIFVVQASHHWYAMLSSSLGTSIIVTLCPLFTAWVLAASFRSASRCPEGLSMQESQFLREALPLSAKSRSGTVGWIRVILLESSTLPSSSKPSESLEIDPLGI